MKRIKLTDKDIDEVVNEFKGKLIEYENSPLCNKSFSFQKDFGKKAEERIHITFTQQAYLRSQALVSVFPGEVGWYGLMRKVADRSYLIYDILVCPQVVSSVTTADKSETNDWYEQDDIYEHLHFQAHSHVDMATSPSTTDINNQQNVVANTQGQGYKLFQIWNKKGEINSFFYDIENNMMYDKNDIDIDILDDSAFGTLKGFIEDAKTYVSTEQPRTPVGGYSQKPVTSFQQKKDSEYPKKSDPVQIKDYYKRQNPSYYEDYYAEDEYIDAQGRWKWL